MNEFKTYLKSLESKYNSEVKFCINEIADEQLKKVPKIMHDFYKVVSEAKLPFGRIFPIERAIKESSRAPFEPNWFVFGNDNYFIFWLCSYNKDKNGLSFTSWDHESGSEIGEATDGDLLSFLKYEEEA